MVSGYSKGQRVFDTDIAIIGMAGRFPDAPDIRKYWNNLKEGRDCISTLKRPFMSSLSETIKAGFIDGMEYFDYAFFDIPPSEARQMDPRQRIFLETAWAALEDSGYSGEKSSGTQTGVFVGVSNNQYGWLLLQNLKGFKNALSNSNSSIANRVSHFMNLRGPSMVIDSSCASSSLAVHQACQSIRNGECEMAIAGGAHLLLSPEVLAVFHRMNILSRSGKNSAFSREADGFVPGEGAGAVVLKSLKDALKDDDHIYAVIKGESVSHGGHTRHFMGINPYSQRDVIGDGLARFRIDPDSVCYVEANGYATVVGDALEIWSISQAFSHSEQEIAIGTAKNNIGNLDPASGIASLIKVALVLFYREMPPIIHFDPPNRFVKIDGSRFLFCQETTEISKRAAPLRAGINSFGLGGTNVFIIVEEPPKTEGRRETAQKQPYRIVTFSAQDKTSLLLNIKATKECIEREKDLVFSDLCYTLNTGRGHFKVREAFVSHSMKRLTEELDRYCRREERQESDKKYSEEYSYAASRAHKSKAKKESSMLKIFLKNYKVSKRHVDIGPEEEYISQYASQYGREEGIRVAFLFSDSLYQDISFDACMMNLMEEVRLDSYIRNKLQKKKVSPQLRSFLFQYSMAYLFSCCGIRPSRLLCYGKSFYVSACIAGRITPQQGLRAVALSSGTQKRAGPSRSVGEQSSAPGSIPIFCNRKLPLDADPALLDGIQWFTTVKDLLRDNQEIVLCFGQNINEAGERDIPRSLPIVNLLGKEQALSLNWLSAMRELYRQGVSIHWEILERAYGGYRIPLPTYCFARTYCWWDKQQTEES